MTGDANLVRSAFATASSPNAVFNYASCAQVKPDGCTLIAGPDILICFVVAWFLKIIVYPLIDREKTPIWALNMLPINYTNKYAI